MATPLEFLHAHRARFEADLTEFLRIPSVSTLPAHRRDILTAAGWLAEYLRTIGMETEVIDTQGNPLVYAVGRGAPGRPTILGYGHYDVQPADPLDLWTTPPFEPVVRGGSLYARGAADDKGQLFTMIAAVRAYLETRTPLPVTIKLLIEGEEECGGAAIEAYVRSHAERFRADAALVLDSSMFAAGIPAVTLGLRGIVMTEVTVTGPSRDLHSGLYGGVAPNPFNALAEIIAGLKDPHGRILVPHFYDRVVPPPPEEKAAWDRLPFDEERFLRDEIGAVALCGEPGFGVLERLWARPTLDVHGMPGGFTGAGSKTVIPARASAKISMRLVADQDPDDIFRAFESHVRSLAPRGTRVDVRRHYAAAPVVIPPSIPAVAAARAALAEAFGHETVLIRSGGSVPIASEFARRLELPVVITGWALPDANMHSPDEKLDLEHFHKGALAVAHFFERVGGV
jgi:acetylornithine deacetylase/succinyl-diaminopimelate desuccinylase-like protein